MKYVCLLSVLALLSPKLKAEEPVVVTSTAPAKDPDVFLSLTRKAEPRKKMPTNVSVVSGKDLWDQNAITLADPLSVVPSIKIEKSGTLGTLTTLRLRGSPNSAQTVILLDDMPLSGVSSRNVDVSQLPVVDLERVEVLRGGASALYGPNAMGGVVRLVSKGPQGDTPLTVFRVGVGSFYEKLYAGEFSARVGSGDVRVSGGRSLSDGFMENQDTDNVFGSFRGGYTALNGARVSAGVSVVDGEVGNPKGTSLPVSEWDGHRERVPVDPYGRVEDKTVRSNQDLFFPLGRSNIKTTFYQSKNEYKTLPTREASPDFKMDSFFWGNDTQWLWDNWLTVGGAYGWDGEKSYSAYGNNGIHVSNIGTYVQADLSKGIWRAIPAVRYDDHSDYSGVWNPRLALVCSPEPFLKISGNASRSFRAPSFLELGARGPGFNGNPNLKPQKSWSYDAGVELISSSSSWIGVTGFYTEMKDYIALTNSGTTVDNAPSAQISGVEVESHHRLFLPSVSGGLAYTYTHAIGNTLGESTRVALRLTPRHMVHCRVWWTPGGRFEWLNTVQYTSKQFYEDGDQGVVLAPYALWGTKVSKRILAAELYFSIDNILDRHYAMTCDEDWSTWPAVVTRNPQPGRTFRVGMSIAFKN